MVLKFSEILQAIEGGYRPSKEEILLLLSAEESQMNDLQDAADRVRRKFVGDEIHLRGIVEFSNFCIQNCWYCGLRQENRQVDRYRMTADEIVDVAGRAKSRGLKTIVLQSGEDPWFTRERMSEIISRVKKSTGLAVTLSLGERPEEDYRAWKRKGADRYLLKFETSSQSLFERLRPGRKISDRLNSLKILKKAGYEVGSGNIIGLPGQTPEDLANDVKFSLDYDFDMIGVGPFIPHPQTPLGRSSPGMLTQALGILALTRILTRDTNLPATTSLSVLNPEARRRALQAGANVLMPDVTPWVYRQHYQIYPGKAQAKLEEDELTELIFRLGRKIGRGPGSRKS